MITFGPNKGKGCRGAHRLFDGMKNIPVHEQDDDGNWIVRDARTGRVMNRSDTKIGPDGKPATPFEPYPVRLLTPIQIDYNEEAPVGSEDFQVEMIPSGVWTITKGITKYAEGVEEGIDFEFI